MTIATQQSTVATIEFLLDGSPVQARPNESILQAAARHGVEIPHLCFKEGYRADGNCRACVVEIAGERTLAPSCCRAPKPGMQVQASSERAQAAQRMVLELLLADAPAQPARPDDELQQWARELGARRDRFAAREQPAVDRSHPAIEVSLDACIQCGRCVRACREEQGNDVIGYTGRGDQARIVFDMGDPMGASTCVACGECVQACPTGALSPRLPVHDPQAGERAVARPGDRQVDSLCPFCGVGCQVTYHVHDERIQRVEGRDGPANQSRLCVKGRFGFDYVHSPDRLTEPLVRKAGRPKRWQFERLNADWRDDFRPATWDEALALAGGTLAGIRDAHGPRALAGFGSAKGSNEEAYLFQKLVRTGFGSNNVDHCTRLCHASSVAALLEGVGSGAVSNQVSDALAAECIFVIGANPTVNHPVAATFIKNAVRDGAKLIVADPRRTDLSRLATHALQFRADSDVAMLNALLHVIIAEGLVDERFVRDRTTHFGEIAANVAACSPEAMAPICGIDADTLRAVARLYARSRASIIFWGMGVSQHVHGTDNVRCLIALAMITGQIGRPGTGLHPLRGQNNVQGASDAGLIPMMLPDYQRVDNPAVRARFEQLWGTALDAQPGLTVVEILHAARAGTIRGMYIMGENPAMSDPDLSHAREALASLDWLVVQDLFPTETASLADVILPASAFAEKSGSFTNTDRMVQLGRAVLAPPGQARPDLWILVQMARRLGLDWSHDDPGGVFEEMRSAMDSIRGISWERLQREGSVTYPCDAEDHPGQPVVFIDRFPTPDGRARLVPASFRPGDEPPDSEYPMLLITGRQLEHWHTGAMTRRSGVLDAIEPHPTVSLHPADLARLGARPGDRLRVASRRGTIELQARADEGVARGSVFIPFAYAEAAANLLTNPALDPFGKIPEFKFCAVAVTVPMHAGALPAE
ncbi:MAG TPA: formate dehydrogenase subunit alpha [Burkholderiaceae bacterium]|nr:formate dehydrogenase subunit alpha [Burkholderiaceae bacterium]